MYCNGQDIQGHLCMGIFALCLCLILKYDPLDGQVSCVWSFADQVPIVTVFGFLSSLEIGRS
jgi:hypothetical protein